MDSTLQTTTTTTITKKHLFLLTNIILLIIGNCGGPLVMRLYFLHGGHTTWLACLLETAGFPILIIPILFTTARPRTRLSNIFNLTPRVLLTSSILGLLIGLDNFLYSSGLSKLPVSTSSLVIASQLVFISIFSFFIVKQKFTAYSINAVVLLTLGALLLGLRSSGDRPKGESEVKYFKGFFMTIGAAAMYGFIMPVVELTYAKAGQEVTYGLVLKMQMVMAFFATVFCGVGMFIDNGFKAIPREAKSYNLGETKYYVLLICSPMVWQCFFLGVIGVIFYASSLLSGVLLSGTLPITEVLAVIIYRESFKVEKGISLFLSIWGFVSYFTGAYKLSKKQNVKKMEKNKKNVGDNEEVAEENKETKLAPTSDIP